jgi:hypothetical protein
MLPGTYDLNLYRGDTTRMQFVLWSDPGKTVPIDLSAASAAAQIRDRRDNGSIVVELICTITPPNTVDVTVPIAATETLPTRGVWDLQLTYSNGDIQMVVSGGVTTTPDVTREGTA